MLIAGGRCKFILEHPKFTSTNEISRHPDIADSLEFSPHMQVSGLLRCNILWLAAFQG